MSRNFETKYLGLLETIKTLPKLSWYYGNITVDQAELLLKNEPNGAFLVRDSSDSTDTGDVFTITFKVLNSYGSVRIDYAKGFFSLSLKDPDLPMFSTLMDLVSYCLDRSIVCKQPVCVLTGHNQHNNVSLYLSKAVSRHVKVHSLMYCCREAVHTYLTKDKFSKLGLPPKLVKNFVAKNPYYDVDFETESNEADVLSQGSHLSGAGSLQLETAGVDNRS